MEGQAVGAKVEVVEPAGGGPEVFGADGDGGYALAFEGLADVEELLPSFGFGQAVFFEDVFSIIDAPLVVGVGDGVLFAFEGDRRAAGGHVGVEFVLVPDVGNGFEEAALDKGVHALTGIPEDYIGGAAGEPIANGCFVAFVVIDMVHYFGEGGLGGGVGCVGIDDEFPRLDGRGHQDKEWD